MNNEVILLGYYGGDEAIALSAWTSTKRDLTPEKISRMEKLIHDLWHAEPVPHGSPFEKGVVHFLVNTEIASHIHALKHRMSSINAESARYKELKEDKFYIPNDWAGIENKAETKLRSDGKIAYWQETLQRCSEYTNGLYHQCIEDLTPILGRKRAKESARFFKMYNSQIQADVMLNMRSFHNFLTQRMDEHAQLEIREVAAEMLKLIKEIPGDPFKFTLKAWGY